MTKSEVNGNQTAQRPPRNLSFSAKSLNSVFNGVKNEVHDKANSAKALALAINNLTSLILTPLNADNGPLFLAQSTDSHRRSISLMLTLHCQLCAVKYISLFKQLTVCQYSQWYSTPRDRMNCRR